MILRLAWRELRQILLSPLSWIVLGVSQLVTGWWFLLLVEQYRTRYEAVVVQVNSPMGVNDLVVLPFFGSVLLLAMLLLGAALLAMRLMADERRSGSIQLLFSAPLRMSELVLGRYLAGFAFLVLLAIPWMLMPLSLEAGTVLDRGRLLSACLGLVLLAALLAAVAMYASCISRQPPLAALLTTVIGMVLLGIDAGARFMGGYPDALLAYLSALSHYEPLVQGVVGTGSLAYFLLFTTGFLVFSVRRLDALRMQA
ncbi:MAG: ABC transporter permease subunit [Ectothiorhodospiraceae bacterium]|nr:ABC transporter permease subunit [Ectothiorhodospiraceae bacterium]